MCEETDHAAVAIQSKSRLLGLLFPYDWSNPAISDDALILNVLERGIYEDICRICAYYGLARVAHSCLDLPDELVNNTVYKANLKRMLNNIRTGFVRAGTDNQTA